MNIDRKIRILALLEATSVNGVAKAVLQFAEEAVQPSRREPEVRLSLANFVRGEGPVSSKLTHAVTAAGCDLQVIRERRAFDFSVLDGLRSLVRSEKPDIIWSNSVKSHLLVQLSGMRRNHAWVAFHHGYTSTDLKMHCYNQLDRLSLRSPDRILTVCQPFAKELTRRGAPADRIRVQHMSVRRFEVNRSEVQRLRQEYDLRPEEKVVLSIGRLSHEKGHADLIKAFVHLKRRGDTGALRLFLVGDGTERSRLENLCELHGVRKSVTFTGHRDDAKSFYAVADVFALPSYTEGSPNVLLEALATGVPVVATAVGGVPEIVENGTSALLVPRANHAQLSEALETALENPDLRQGLVLNGMQVVARHSPEGYYHGLMATFREALGERGIREAAAPVCQEGLR